MATQRWYQKASVQAALVVGFSGVTAALIGLYGRSTPSADRPNSQSATTATPANASVGLAYDRDYSTESASARRGMRGQLRPLTAAESSLQVSKLPAGTFGFVHPMFFQYNDAGINRVPIGRLSFEVHKLSSTEIYAVSFVNADAKRKLELSGTVQEPTTLYSDRWPDAPYAVRVLASSCGTSEPRIVTLDDGTNVVAVECTPKFSK